MAAPDLERLVRAAAARAAAAQAHAQAQVDALARAAFDRVWRYLMAHPEASPRAAVLAAQVEFGGAFAEALAEAFSTLLARSVGTAEVRAMPVGEVTLSRRLYLHATGVAGEVTALVREHAKGVHQARELALRLYDGYSPEEGIRRPLEGQARATLPKALRALTQAPEARQSLAALVERGQAQAARLKSQALRAAYSEALQAWADGEGQEVLERRLGVALREKNRYFAERIARTELHRAHQAEVGTEMMADASISVVQVRMNPRHPRTDICDLHARADLFGLGPGCYPKARAPRPPFHPHCWCRLSTRPDLDAGDARPQPLAAQAWLRGLPEAEAARVMGSRGRLQEVLAGASPLEVANRGVPAGYRTVRLGEMPSSAQSGTIADAYDTAKSGGKHHGFLAQLPGYGVRQRRKAAKSFQEQVDLHLDKLARPEKYVQGWSGLRESHRESILREWRKEVLDHQEQIEILKGYENEHS